MNQLSGQSVFNLSARQENIAESWINYSLVWGSGIPSVSVTRSDTGLGYTWTGTAATSIQHLSPNTFYLCLVSINESTARMQVLNVNQTNYSIITPWNLGVVFDTGPMADSYLFPRRRGRIGFTANLLDGDAQIRAIRPHALTYAKWQSVPMQSNTPVNGARLYASYAPHEQLWTNWSALAGQNNSLPLLNTDTSRTTSGSSTKVTIQNGAAINQGIISNILTPPDDPLAGIIDWGNTQVYFDVWFPQTGLQNPLSAYLLSQDGAQIPLTLPAIAPGSWQTITCFPPAVPPQYLSVMQSGRYQLVLLYTGTQALSFWVDNVRVIERTVTWDARANATDPWTTFGDLVSSNDAGALFNKGTQLQVRALAHRQDDVVLSPPQVIPRYASLGNLVWPENQVADPISSIAPNINVTGSLTHGSPVTFDASTSVALSSTNLVPDPSFEVGSATWTAWGTNTIARSTTQAHTGSFSLQAVYQNDTRLASSPNYGSAMTKNEVRTIAAWVYVPSAWTGGQITLDNDLATSTNLVFRYANMALTNQWQLIWLVYYPSNTPNRNVFIRTASAATPGQFIYIDDVLDVAGDGRTPLSSFVWNFGDGNVGNGAKVAHTYLIAGQYNVSCTLSDIYGNSTIFTTIVSVS